MSLRPKVYYRSVRASYGSSLLKDGRPRFPTWTSPTQFDLHAPLQTQARIRRSSLLPSRRVRFKPQASYLVYELAGAAMDSMTLSHDWEWRPCLHGARFLNIGAFIIGIGFWGFLIITIIWYTPNPIRIIKAPISACVLAQCWSRDEVVPQLLGLLVKTWSRRADYGGMGNCQFDLQMKKKITMR